MKASGGLLILVVTGVWTASSYAQEPVPMNRPIGRTEAPLTMRDYSRIYVVEPPPRAVKVHDIITVLVDEKSEVTVDSRFNRQRNAQLVAELKEFLRIDEAGNLATAAENEPGIDAQLRSRLNSYGQLQDKEGIRYRIAATVVDVLPNGNLILEARKSIRTNRDVWEYRLTGEISLGNVDSRMSAKSEDIANLFITKHQSGKVFDSTKLPWGIRLYDIFAPF